MPRYKLTIEYDGTDFAGWQRQGNGPSIQQSLEEALARLGQKEPLVAGAGRTDAGVHALGQVAHVDLDREWVGWRLKEAINGQLAPLPIAVLDAESIDDHFNARRSAIMRWYVYRVVNRRAPLTLERDRAWRLKRELDVEAMAEAAKALIGRHDFTTFRDVQCQANSPVRTLSRLDIARDGERIAFSVAALSFLHRQVRSMVGSLVEVGLGRWSPADLKAALEAADRSRCGHVAPACGLYLARVDYAEGKAGEDQAF
jgi:tRNA pseudouridine38-40 synthase